MLETNNEKEKSILAKTKRTMMIMMWLTEKRVNAPTEYIFFFLVHLVFDCPGQNQKKNHRTWSKVFLDQEFFRCCCCLNKPSLNNNNNNKTAKSWSTNEAKNNKQTNSKKKKCNSQMNWLYVRMKKKKSQSNWVIAFFVLLFSGLITQNS